MEKTISERATIAGQAYQFGKDCIESDAKVYERGYIQGAIEERAEFKEYLENKKTQMLNSPLPPAPPAIAVIDIILAELFKEE